MRNSLTIAESSVFDFSFSDNGGGGAAPIGRGDELTRFDNEEFKRVFIGVDF